MNAALFRRFACRPAAFLSVWGGQPEGDPSLLNFKLHTARVRVCIGLAALVGVLCGVDGQPVLEAGVVGADVDQRFFFVKPNFCGFLTLCQSCFHTRLLPSFYHARVTFFGYFLWLMTLKKRRISNRNAPDDAQPVQRVPVGYFRIFTALHCSYSQLHVALLAARHITASGLLRLLRLGVEHELYELLDLAGRSFECRHEILCLLLQLFIFSFPSGVKRIRVHDIRHSHASLLVEMGFSPLLIAERLGHEKVQTTMDTYSHLYPNKQVEVARQLDGIMP